MLLKLQCAIIIRYFNDQKALPRPPGPDAIKEPLLLPPCDICLGLTKQAGLLHAKPFVRGLFLDTTARSAIIIRELAPQEPHDVSVDELELEQEAVMALRRRNNDEFGVGYVVCDLLLLRGREETVGLDADDECAWGEHREDTVQGGIVVLAWELSVPCKVVGVELACNVDVAVGVEPRDELVALVAQVRLSGEYCGLW